MSTSRRAPYKTSHPEMRAKRLADDHPKEPKRTRPPQRLQKEMVEKARAMTDLALQRLRGILEDEEADLTHVIAAAKEVLNRGYGAVPQHHIVEALFTHQHQINTDALRQMSTEQLTALETMLTPFAQPVEDAEVIEHDPDA